MEKTVKVLFCLLFVFVVFTLAIGVEHTILSALDYLSGNTQYEWQLRHAQSNPTETLGKVRVIAETQKVNAETERTLAEARAVDASAVAVIVFALAFFVAIFFAARLSQPRWG